MNSLIDKIRLLIKIEKLKQKEFSQLTGIPVNVVRAISINRQKTINADNLIKIITHERFKKYTLWLISEDPETLEKSDQEMTTEDVLETIDDLPADTQLQADTMAKMIIMERKSSLISELSDQLNDLENQP